MLEYAGNIFFLNSNKISSGQKSNKIVLNKEKKKGKLDSDYLLGYFCIGSKRVV